MDKITKPEEPWFQHLQKFVDQGACAFKLMAPTGSMSIRTGCGKWYVR
ncbi:MAG: hypothetical protein ACLR23_09205 [Clostridia bacterium]